MKTKLKTELPPMSRTGKRRLRKLIAFLRQLPRRKFDFAEIVTKGKHNGHTCGTVCCALGWMPAVFPKVIKWKFEEDFWGGGDFVISKGRSKDYRKIAKNHFGISYHHAQGLFHPGEQMEVHSALPICGEKATAKQVAAMLEQYIRLTETPAK